MPRRLAHRPPAGRAMAARRSCPRWFWPRRPRAEQQLPRAKKAPPSSRVARWKICAGACVIRSSSSCAACSASSGVAPSTTTRIASLLLGKACVHPPLVEPPGDLWRDQRITIGRHVEIGDGEQQRADHQDQRQRDDMPGAATGNSGELGKKAVQRVQPHQAAAHKEAVGYGEMSLRSLLTISAPDRPVRVLGSDGRVVGQGRRRMWLSTCRRPLSPYRPTPIAAPSCRDLDLP